jgi:glycosyltransferase involved in cell wall biosynthesis
MPWAAWIPIDHDPLPKPVAESLEKGKPYPVAMSRFGQKKLIEAGFEEADYVPHGIEPELLLPVDREHLRDGVGWKDRFVITMVAANKGIPSRKSFPEAMMAFAEFAKDKPEALLYLHTNMDAPWGVNLQDMAKGIGIKTNQLMFADKYKYVVGQDVGFMREMYTASDLFINPARGEGFGVPIIEAQACGLPVVVTNWTAMPELCYYGDVIGGKKVYTNQNSYQMIPDVGELYAAMEKYYAIPEKERIEEGQKARKIIEDNYHPDIIMERHFIPAMERAIEALKDRKLLSED